MNSVFGWLGHSAGNPADVLSHMAKAGKSGPSAASERAALALGSTSAGKTGAFAQDGQILAAIVGYPRWTDPALAAQAHEHNHAAALVSAYRRFGASLLDRLAGSFALAILEPERRNAVLAIDRMGIEPLCYANPEPDLLVFGPTTDSVRAHPAVGATVRLQALYDFFYFIDRIPAPETIYREQQKLPPGHCVQVTDGDVKVAPYWRMTYAPSSDNEDLLRAELLERLRAAVAASTEGEDPDRVGAFLSGGLDSSTVLGLLAERAPQSKAFTIGFDADGFDETPYAKIAAAQFGSPHDIYYLQPDDVLAAIDKIADVYDEPFANSSAVPAYFCALRAQQSGTRVLLAGDGGDEIFAGNSRYLKDRIFDRYLLIPGPLRRDVIEPALRSAPWLQRVPVARKVPRYVELARQSVAERMTGDNLYKTIDPREIFSSDLLSEISRDSPVALANAIFDETASEAKIHQMMHLDLRITLADSDIRKVNRMCELAGIEVRYPMLDDDLVAFSGTIPPGTFMNGGLRGFYKSAVSELLPPEILTKEKKGFGLPYTELLSRHKQLTELACDSLQALKSRGYFRGDFIDRVTDEVNAGANSPLVSIAWDLMMLEKWFETRMPS